MSKNIKKILIFALGVIFAMSMSAVIAAAAGTDGGMLNVGDFVKPGTGEDVYAQLQAVIDNNPNRTLYFPDGEYIVSQSLCTPADPAKSVSLHLADFAVIKAAENFEGGAVIRLGGKDAYNTTRINGSNYSLIGGIIDGSNIADGVSIDSGRETKIQNTSIKHTVVGLHIKYGANSGSSDADITDVNIIGNGTRDAVGMLIEGYDNTFTNMRIGYVYNGVIMKSGGNALTNIHPLYQIGWDNYPGSCGFIEENSNNLYTYCYSDQFETCFRIVGNGRSVYTGCFGFWWSGEGKTCTGFKVEGDKFNSTVTDTRIDFRADTDNTVYDGPVVGSGRFNNLMINNSNINSDVRYKSFVSNSIWMKFRTFFEKIKNFFLFIGSWFK